MIIPEEFTQPYPTQYCYKTNTQTPEIKVKGYNVIINQEEEPIKKEAKEYMNKKQHKIIVKKLIKHLNHFIRTDEEYKAADAETKKEIMEHHFNYLLTDYNNLKWLNFRDKNAINEEYLSKLLKDIGNHFKII